MKIFTFGDLTHDPLIHLPLRSTFIYAQTIIAHFNWIYLRSCTFGLFSRQLRSFIFYEWEHGLSTWSTEH